VETSRNDRVLSRCRTQGVKHGVVAVCLEGDRYLVIRRSQKVRAPGLLCFPGGHIEANETFEQAIVREISEELSMPIEVIDHLWSSITSWGTHLEWIQIRRLTDTTPTPNLDEVSHVMWLTEHELLGSLDILTSVSDFFDAKYSGRFVLRQT
jgi:8-oxo-dGTP diphosphatase